MRRITPYKYKKSAITALDNGGRFYNFLTDPNDGEITAAELGKVAGVFSNRQQMHLYLEMSICELEADVKDEVLGMLTPKLRASSQVYRPRHLTPANAASSGRASVSAIVVGTPKYVESCSDFNGFIMIPISTGKTMTMMMVPLIDHYDVYEIRSKSSDQKFLIAHARGQRKLRPVETRFGGIIKKLQPKKGEEGKHKVFLETLYYTEMPKLAAK